MHLPWTIICASACRSSIDEPNRPTVPGCRQSTKWACVDDTYEQALDAATPSLRRRYAMDFGKPAQRYCASGPATQVLEGIRRFHEAGARHVILDFVGPSEQRLAEVERFAGEALPLLADLRGL